MWFLALAPGSVTGTLPAGPGWGAGLPAGGLTQPAVIGVAADAITQSPTIPAAGKAASVDHDRLDRARCDAADSRVPVLSHTAPHAIGNVLTLLS